MIANPRTRGPWHVLLLCLMLAAAALLCALPIAAQTPAAGARTQARAPLEEVMSALEAKYGTNDKKYAALADKIEKELAKTLASKTWTGAGDQARPLKEHPYFQMIDDLSTAALDAATKKNSPLAKEMLTQFPWESDLQLVLGLQYGSNRAVPEHDAGFIHLGRAAGSPGFPDLTGNQVLFGLRELVGWQYLVKSGKKLSFEGRDAKQAPVLATSLPGWERVRMYLQGALPEVSLYAVPWMTHAIHARIAERSASSSAGEEASMDRMLALLDSKWNGFTFDAPYSKERVAFVMPVHAIFTERNGFVYQFPSSEELASVGDIPFVSVTTFQQYADEFRGERLGPGDFIQRTPAAEACQAQFNADSNYLARYKKLIAEFVFAVLTPNAPYPAHLAVLDYPDGAPPSARERRGEFDVPRKHAVLVWAHCGKDTSRLADYLYDNVLGQAANRYPNDVVLPNELTRHVRENDAELVRSVAERLAQERAELEGSTDFECEFSPHATFLDQDAESASDFLLHSFHTFHASATAAVQDAAYAIVAKEIGK